MVKHSGIIDEESEGNVDKIKNIISSSNAKEETIYGMYMETIHGMEITRTSVQKTNNMLSNKNVLKFLSQTLQFIDKTRVSL